MPSDSEHLPLSDGYWDFLFLRIWGRGTSIGFIRRRQRARFYRERSETAEALLEKSHLNQTLLNAFPCIALLLRPRTREIVASNAAVVKVGALPVTHCFSTWGQRKDPCPGCWPRPPGLPAKRWGFAGVPSDPTITCSALQSRGGKAQKRHPLIAPERV